MKELKRCPFCGGRGNVKAHQIGIKRFVFVECVKCGATSSMYRVDNPRIKDDVNPAIRSWNTRKPIDEIITKLESHFMAEENHINMGIYLDAINILKGAINEQTTDTTL